MAVVVGVTEHLSPCRRRAADEGSFSNLGGPTQVAESSCRAQPHIRVLGRRYHRLGNPSHTTRASRSGFSNCGPPVRHRPDSWWSLRCARVPPVDYLDKPRISEHGSRFNRHRGAMWVRIQPALTTGSGSRDTGSVISSCPQPATARPKLPT